MDTTSTKKQKQEKPPRPTREEHLAKCKEIALNHIHGKGLMVFYIRKRKPNFLTKVPYELATEIKKVLDIFPDMNEKAYAGYLNAKSDDPAVEYAHDSEELKAFRTVRSVVQSKKSPLIGMIVAFKDGDDIKIGWSLCNIGRDKPNDAISMLEEFTMGGKPRDQFNRYEGMRRAIERAWPIDVVSACIDLPHTCRPYVEQMIERAKKRFAPRKAE